MMQENLNEKRGEYMDLYNELEQLCRVVEDEIKRVNQKLEKSGGELTGDDISYVDKLTHAMKSIKTTMAMIESEDEYSNYGGYDQNGGGSYRNYPNGGSYARGRGTYAKRDSRGRYSSNGYSSHGDMAEELRRLMNEAPNDQIRMDIQRLADKVEQM